MRRNLQRERECGGYVDEEVRRRYGELVAEKQVEFVTFHQSYGYEEFVEGLRPDEDSAGVGFRLVATDGVLKRIAEHAKRERDLPMSSSLTRSTVPTSQR